MLRLALGLVETVGLAAAMEAADAAVKSANVSLIGYELTKGDGMVTVKFEGDVGAVKAAVDSATAAAAKVGVVYSSHVIPRPAQGLENIILSKETVGLHKAEAPAKKEQQAEQPVQKEPDREKHVAEEPVEEKSIAEESVTEKSVSEESVTEKSVSEECIPEEPAKEVQEEPAKEVQEEPGDEPEAEEPEAEEPEAEEPAPKTGSGTKKKRKTKQ